MLDIRKNPARPHYNLANELPLCLFDCTYSADQFDWIFDIPTLTNVIGVKKLKSYLKKIAFIFSIFSFSSKIMGAVPDKVVIIKYGLFYFYTIF